MLYQKYIVLASTRGHYSYIKCPQYFFSILPNFKFLPWINTLVRVYLNLYAPHQFTLLLSAFWANLILVFLGQNESSSLGKIHLFGKPPPIYMAISIDPILGFKKLIYLGSTLNRQHSGNISDRKFNDWFAQKY